jgi:hypothetical protein
MMDAIEKVRYNLIDKIISINNQGFLEALDQLIVTRASQMEKIEVSIEQKLLLEKSEDDIKNGRLISQEEMSNRNIEWLNSM